MWAHTTRIPSLGQAMYNITFLPPLSWISGKVHVGLLTLLGLILGGYVR